MTIQDILHLPWETYRLTWITVTHQGSFKPSAHCAACRSDFQLFLPVLLHLWGVTFFSGDKGIHSPSRASPQNTAIFHREPPLPRRVTSDSPWPRSRSPRLDTSTGFPWFGSSAVEPTHFNPLKERNILEWLANQNTEYKRIHKIHLYFLYYNAITKREGGVGHSTVALV